MDKENKQNAAESLPAQVEQKVVYDAWGKAGRLQPVASIEVKEKKPVCATCDEPIYQREEFGDKAWCHTIGGMIMSNGHVAEPKQEKPVAGGLSHEEHRRACMFNLPAAVFGSAPRVAPVEAKGVCWNGKHHGPHLKADDCARWTNDKKWAALAEPKPAPSINLRAYEVGPSYWTDRVVHFEKVYKCASASFMEAYKAGLLSPNNLDFDEWSSIVEAQTQPDEALRWAAPGTRLVRIERREVIEVREDSMNQLKVGAKEKHEFTPFRNGVCEKCGREKENYKYHFQPQPDSSSISTEQTFERVWNKFVAANDTEEWKASDIAEWFWNAAKGQNNEK